MVLLLHSGGNWSGKLGGIVRTRRPITSIFYSKRRSTAHNGIGRQSLHRGANNMLEYWTVECRTDGKRSGGRTTGHMNDRTFFRRSENLIRVNCRLPSQKLRFRNSKRSMRNSRGLFIGPYLEYCNHSSRLEGKSHYNIQSNNNLMCDFSHQSKKGSI